jgi:hypothetical protein
MKADELFGQGQHIGGSMRRVNPETGVIEESTWGVFWTPVDDFDE